MADPIEEQIVANIVTTLETINPGNGYYTNAGHRVLKYLEGWQQPDGGQLPCFYVVIGNEPEPENAQGSGSNRCYTSVVEVAIWSYVERKPGTDDLADQVVKVKADIRVAMMTDLTRGNVALWTDYLGSSTDEGYYAEGNRAAVVATFAVHYKWSLTAP